MKHALLITAYKDFDALVQLIAKFDDGFNIYIHIDKKSKIPENRLLTIQKTDNVRFVGSNFKVNWGGVNHLKAYLFLCQKALQDPENAYFHLITGEDYPIKSLKGFKALLSNDQNVHYSFMEYFALPTNEWDHGGLNRLVYYNFYDVFNAKTSVGIFCIRLLLKLQRFLHFKRPIRFSQKLFGGSTYWTLSREAVEYVLTFTNENPSFLKRFDHTFCAEEMYFQTILMNSIHADKIKNTHLRYVDWESGRGGYPAYLDKTDFEAIVQSNALFARKISSEKLKDMISSHTSAT